MIDQNFNIQVGEIKLFDSTCILCILCNFPIHSMSNETGLGYCGGHVWKCWLQQLQGSAKLSQEFGRLFQHWTRRNSYCPGVLFLLSKQAKFIIILFCNFVP